MKSNYLKRRILAGLLTMTMIVPSVSNIAYAEKSDSESLSISMVSADEEVASTEVSYMEDGDYEAFGFDNLPAADSFVEDSYNPLDGYQPMIQNELYIGHLNHPDDYKGYFATAENVETFSEGNLNLDTMQNNNVGGKQAYYDYSDMQTQAIKTIGVTPGNMNEEGAALREQILVETRVYQDTDGRDSSDFRVQAYSLVNGSWKGGGEVHLRMDKKDDWVGNITIREQGGYNSMTTGDFDQDGYNEVAVFCPYSASSSGCIYIYQPKENSDGTYDLVKENEFWIKDLGSRFNWADGEVRPLVSMATTDMAGKDDIVLSVTLPYDTKDEACNDGIVAILSFNGSGYVKVWEDSLVFGSGRMKLQNVANADLNGDGQDEIVIAGHKNTGYENGDDRGDIDEDKMFVNILLHNGSSYYLAWDDSAVKEVPRHPDLYVDNSENDPISLTAGRYFTSTYNDTVFCEGVFLHFNADTSQSEFNDQIVNGEFKHNANENLKFANTDEPFVGTVATGTFIKDQSVVEQTVVMHGHNALGDDTCDINITWFYGSNDEYGNNTMKQIETNNDYINDADEDGNGTCLVLAPVNVDGDSYYIKYKERYYGYSNPAVIGVMLSQPYWEEFDYGSSKGSTTFSVSYTESTDITHEGTVGLDFNVGFGGSGEFFGNKAQAGVDINIAASYAGGQTDSQSTTITKSFSSYGEDMAAVMVVPIVSYYYDIINPVTGETEPFVVNTSYTPAFANISVEKYNNTASQYNNKLDEGEPALSLINLDEMYFEGYQAGDPSSYPNKTDDIKGIEGDDFRVSDNVSVDVNGDGSIELSFADSVGRTQANGVNVSLGIGGSFHTELGLKVLGIGGGGYLNVTGHLAGSYGYSYAVTESEGFSYAGNLINLPAAAQTGTDEYGNPTSDYAYSARLVQWNHTQNVLAEADENGEVVSQKVPYIGYITTTLLTPPRRVQDLKVLTTTKHSALLKWTKPEDREVNGETISVDSYKIYMSTDPNGEFTAVQKDGKDVEIAGNSTSYLVSGLEAGVTYYFKLQSLTEMKDGSSLSKVAVGTTKKSTAPIITKHPDDIVAEGIDYPEYKVAARSFETNSTLTYQWQKKEGNSWVELEGATETTFNPAYHPETNPTGILQGYGDALIGSDNNYLSLDGAEYRCAVTETQAGGAKETIYSNSATLDVVEAYAGKTNVELRLTGYPFESDGDVYQIAGGQVQLNYKFIDQPDLFDTPVTIILVNAETGEFVEGFPMDVKTEEYNASGNIFLNTLEKGVYYAIAEYEGNNSIMPTSSVAEVIHITDEIHIDYELNGGTNSVYNPDVLSMETEAFGLYAPQKENHEFLGWYYDKELTKPLDGAEQNVLYPSESTSDSITVYAAWEENKYSVTYELNGGVNGDNPTEIAAGDVVTLKEASKEGYAFEGWYLDKEYTIPCEAVSGAEKKDIIVYAKWSEPVAYAIQYMTGEGVNAESNPLTYTIESEEIVFADASRKGYEFMGWYKDAELTEKITGIPSGSTGDVIVYADWKLIDQLEPNADGVYEIDSYEDLVAMAEMVKAAPEKYAKASYEQTANIQCGMQEWSLAIGSADAPFEGTYEGNDYYILALRPTSSAAGVFGVIGENGIVRNLSVVDFDYEEEARVAGGLAGVNFGTIDGCGSGINLNSAATIYRNGEEVPISTLDSIIRASKCAGGLVAVNEGIIRNSRSSADIVMGESEEENYAGGIAGFNEGTIINVYHTGAITGGNYAGGIAGANDGTIQYGYNAGSVTGTTAGGIAGMSSNTEIQDMYYADNMERACGDQEDSSLGVTKKTVDTMKSQEFADELNELISDVEGLTEWDYSETKNEGYPRNVKDNTVTAIRQNVQFVNPEDGEEPSDPDNPADPEKPDKPDKPDKPNKPTKPDSPSKPGAAFVNIIRKAVQTISKWFGWLFRR